MSTALRQKMIEDMQLRSLSTRTQASYVGAMRRLVAYYHKSPELITEAELRQYFPLLKRALISKETSPSGAQA